jgi:hypothetical protein
LTLRTGPNPSLLRFRVLVVSQKVSRDLGPSSFSQTPIILALRRLSRRLSRYSALTSGRVCCSPIPVSLSPVCLYFFIRSAGPQCEACYFDSKLTLFYSYQSGSRNPSIRYVLHYHRSWGIPSAVGGGRTHPILEQHTTSLRWKEQHVRYDLRTTAAFR